MEFGGGIEDAKAPVDAGFSLVPLQFQGMDLSAERFLVWETLSEATAREDAELDLRHIEPTAVLVGVVKLQPLGDAPCLHRREGSHRGTPRGGCSSCPEPGGPPERRDMLHPSASASGGGSLASFAAGSLPHGASPPWVHRTGTGCGCPPSGTRSPGVSASRAWLAVVL